MAFQPGCTTRYWDCCKTTFSWDSDPPKSTAMQGSIRNCLKDGVTTQLNTNPWNDRNALLNSYPCNNHDPFVINPNVAYGFTSYGQKGNLQHEQQRGCACYHLAFTNTAVAGKDLVVQVTNTGDLYKCANHFDLQIPGSGFGEVNCCINPNDGSPDPTRALNGNYIYQYGAPAHNGYNWGPKENQNRGGVTSRAACDTLPLPIRDGCYWRFDWFKNADNPNVNFRRVKCPIQLTNRSLCKRSDDDNYPLAPGQ